METQQKRSTPLPSKRSLRIIGMALGTVGLALVTYFIVSIAPLVAVKAQEAYVMYQIGVSKQRVIKHEKAMQKEIAHQGELQAWRARLIQRAIEITNRGVSDPRPIKIETAFQAAGK